MSNQKKQNSYTSEIKESTVKLAIDNDLSVSNTANELGVNPNTLYTWIHRYRRPQVQKAGQINEEHLYGELKRLLKENKRLTEGSDILEGGSVLFEGKRVKYAFIEHHNKTFTETRMCKLMDVSQSAYYDWQKLPESTHSLERKLLGVKVKESHEKRRSTYVARRILKDLMDDEESISRILVGRLTKQQGLESKSKRNFKATTHSNHGRAVAPNLLERGFMVEKPDAVYAGDITYIQTVEGWLYLAVLIDLYSRAVVGWAMSERMPSQLVNVALLMVNWKRKSSKGLMVHSDRGSQYASDLYQKTIKDHGLYVWIMRLQIASSID